MVLRWWVRRTRFTELGIEPKEPKLCCAIIQRVPSPTNHVNHIVCLISLKNSQTKRSIKIAENVNLGYIVSKVNKHLMHNNM